MKIFNYLSKPIVSTNTSITSKDSYNNYTSNLNFKSDVFVRSTENLVKNSFGIDLVTKFLEIFKKKSSEISQNIKLKISPNSGQILGFSKTLSNGNTLDVIKHSIRKNFKNYFYVSLVESKNDKIRNAFGIDMDSKEFIKLSQKGSIKFVLEDLLKISSQNPEYEEYNELLEKYLTEIYQNTEKDQATKEILSSKAEQTTKRITVDDLLDEDVVLALPKIDETLDPSEFEEFSLLTQIEGIQKKTPPAKAEKTKVTPPKTTQQTALKHPKQILPKEQPSNTAKSPKTISEKQAKLVKNAPYEIREEAKQLANIKPVILKNVKTTRNTIDTNNQGVLNPNLKNMILECEKILFEMIDFLNTNRGNIDKIKKLKEEYKPLYYKKYKQKTITFKLDSKNTLGIIHTKIGKNFTRIIYTDNKKNETHFLIENGEKIVSNLNKKKPWVVPIKFRYMTQEQIDNSNIDRYIPFIRDEIIRYYNYLKENL